MELVLRDTNHVIEKNENECNNSKNQENENNKGGIERGLNLKEKRRKSRKVIEVLAICRLIRFRKHY